MTRVIIKKPEVPTDFEMSTMAAGSVSLVNSIHFRFLSCPSIQGGGWSVIVQVLVGQDTEERNKKCSVACGFPPPPDEFGAEAAVDQSA